VDLFLQFGYRIAFEDNFLCGGHFYAPKIANLVEDKIGKVDKALECCCGLGNIGYALHAKGLCNQLVLSDINPALAPYIKRTNEWNGLDVPFIISDVLYNVRGEYDLVVCGPPWYNTYDDILPSKHPRLWRDTDWRFHTLFYSTVVDSLTDNGIVLVSNAYESAEPEFWLDFAKDLDYQGGFPLSEKALRPSTYLTWWTMSKRKKEIRAAFRKAVFERDGYCCRGCGFPSSPDKAEQELDAHHITDRKEIVNGGYVKENGISLCKANCHLEAESHHNGEEPAKGYSPFDLYNLIGSSHDKAVKASERL
jgi:5-methylcytosine-specific restriction endonuclease McrA